MIIQFNEKPVYERIWTGGVDQILSYNTDNAEFTVRSLSNGEERTHFTSLDCMYLSFTPTRSTSTMDYECIEYVIKKGVRSLSRIPDNFNELIHNTIDKMKELIELLQKINGDEIEVKATQSGHFNIIEAEKDSIPDKIQGLATSVLITSEGRCHWDNINKLKDLGFDVFPGEQDSFGWLTGCIKTKKGIIVFG